MKAFTIEAERYVMESSGIEVVEGKSRLGEVGRGRQLEVPLPNGAVVQQGLFLEAPVSGVRMPQASWNFASASFLVI